jgi:hypothetical protein
MVRRRRDRVPDGAAANDVQDHRADILDATMLALERSYTDFNYGIRAMAINLPGFAFHKAFKVICSCMHARSILHAKWMDFN